MTTIRFEVKSLDAEGEGTLIKMELNLIRLEKAHSCFGQNQNIIL